MTRSFSPTLFIALLLVIVGAVSGCASSRSFGSSVDDVSADTSLKRVLLFDRDYDYSDIDITVFEGRAMLTGTMRSLAGQARLVENAFKAPNVTQVIDETVLTSKTRFSQGFQDGRIDQSLRARLIADRGISNRNFKVAVSAGVIYIIGVARDETELSRALNLAQSVSGTRGVVSHVLYQDDPARNARTHN